MGVLDFVLGVQIGCLHGFEFLVEVCDSDSKTDELSYKSITFPAFISLSASSRR